MNKKTLTLIISLFCLITVTAIISFALTLRQNKQPTTSPPPTNSNTLPSSPTPSTDQFCGGITGAICPQGYKCKYDGNFPDSGGICIPN